MIFAHGPAGFLAAYLYRKYSKKIKFPDKQVVYLFVISFIGGIILDIDLFYYYFVSAEISHRQLPTHSLFIWLLVFLIIFSSGKLLKNNFIKIAGIFFFLGNLSHLLCDTLYAGVMFSYPFSNKLIGIQHIPFISGDFYSNNILLVNYSLESLIITFFCIIIIKYIIHNLKII
ncbi:MAG: metal-dependent hydrolase, partial [Patescibacteria group bacterium]